jgi:putative ABC transport system permease protein
MTLNSGLMLVLKLAFRNLFRQKVRSLIALGAIAFGVVSLLLSGGFIEWIFYAMARDTIHSLLGHIQIARPGYFDEGSADPFAYLLPEESNLSAVIAASADVKTVTSRLTFGGLVSYQEATVSFLGEGVEPEKERELSRFLNISQGRNLSDSHSNDIIVGEGLAANLGVKPGDTVALLVNTASGGLNAIEGRIVGCFYTLSKAYDEVALRLPLSTAKKLLRVDGSQRWIVLLNETERTEVAIKALRSQLAASNASLELKSWRDLADFYNKTVELYSQQMNVVKVIIALIVILSISNTMTMNVLERTGEIGTLMAVGTKKRRILTLFLSEGLILGASGGCAGIFMGVLLATIISAVGIPMPPAPGMSHGFTAEIFVTKMLTLEAFVLAALTAVAASIYPAITASRMDIVDALRHNR